MERVELAALLRHHVGGVASSRTRDDQAVSVISESDQRAFMQTFAAAVAGASDILLANPAWGSEERAQLAALLQAEKGDLIPNANQGWLGIPTGGTEGRVKFARHDAATLAAAVQGFCRHFALTQVNAVGVLPLHHVSGLMAWLRCVLTGGHYLASNWKAIEAGVLPELPAQKEGWVLSLVPTQLERLLRQPVTVAWLAQFRIIFVGGAPTRPELLAQAAALGLPLSLGYGMTETAAMVTALRPEEFLAGVRDCGLALPHAQVRTDGDGTILIQAASLFRGYWPEWRRDDWFATSDTGRLGDDNHLQIHGRRDAVIISGGEKVDPAEVQTVLREGAGFSDVVVLGVPDGEWGQRVVAAYPASMRPDLERVNQALARLAAVKRPKAFVALVDWPVNTLGKVNRAEVERRVLSLEMEKID